MKPFAAIVVLTMRQAFRSHLFRILLALLIFCCVFVPGTVVATGGDELVRVTLLYSFGIISFLLVLSSVWLGCSAMTEDIENRRFSLIAVKPIPRWVSWLGKFCGVWAIHVILLLLSGAIVYGIVTYRAAHAPMPTVERNKLYSEVLTGRRVFLPERRNYEQAARQIAERRIAEKKRQGRRVDDSVSGHENLYHDILKSLNASQSELKYAGRRAWVFENLPEQVRNETVFLRFRPFVGEISSAHQRLTTLWWELGVPRVTGKSGKYELFFLHPSAEPMSYAAGKFHEVSLLPEWQLITPDSSLHVAVRNFDSEKTSVFFQQADGPKLLVKIASFEENFCRALVVVTLELAFVTALTCAFAGFMSAPTAIFASLSYFGCGFLSATILGRNYLHGVKDEVGLLTSRAVLFIILPLERFDVVDLLADGELIEWSQLAKLVFVEVLPRLLIFVLPGIWFYQRRELGLAGKR